MVIMDTHINILIQIVQFDKPRLLGTLLLLIHHVAHKILLVLGHPGIVQLPRLVHELVLLGGGRGKDGEEELAQDYR